MTSTTTIARHARHQTAYGTIVNVNCEVSHIQTTGSTSIDCVLSPISDTRLEKVTQQTKAGST
jgi:hypothetical protein